MFGGPLTQEASFQESIELSAPAKRGQNPLDVVYEKLSSLGWLMDG